MHVSYITVRIHVTELYIYMQFHFISRLDYGASLLGHECKPSIYTIDISADAVWQPGKTPSDSRIEARNPISNGSQQRKPGCTLASVSYTNMVSLCLHCHCHSAVAGQSSKSHSKHCQCPGSPALLKDSNSGPPGLLCTQMESSAKHVQVVS
jgi:hypothetical protein